MKKLLFFTMMICTAATAFAQASRQDIFKGDVELTFLGLDFTQAKFIGEAAQWKDAGEVTNNAMKEKYIPAWNDMFVSSNEQKNFKIADATNRTEVSYAIDVVEKVNNAISKKEFFSTSMDDYPRLDETKISALVKKYSFAGNKGIGLIFFVEGMRKGEEKGDPSYATVWVTFVDMSSKTVLLTKRVQGKAGGFGFRNFWAGAWKNVIKEMKNDWSDWRKEK